MPEQNPKSSTENRAVEVQLEENHEAEGATTFDVSTSADEARERFEHDHDRQVSVEMPVISVEDQVEIRVEIHDTDTTLVFPVDKQVVIGRRDPATGLMPELDLTPYGGYQMGISRSHATIQARNGKLEIVDMGSRNGTFLDGKRLVANHPVPLRDGGEIRMGKIIMRVYMQDAY